MRYLDLRIVEGYREVTQKFSQTADPNEVKKIIDAYRDLVNRNQVQGNERNIDWWGKQGWGNFVKFVQAKSQQSSQTQIKKRSNVGNSYTIEETDQWLVVVPLDKDASCFHGKDSDWCTTKPTRGYFEKYFRDQYVTLIYFLQKQTGAKWAMAVYQDGDGNVEYFDKNDNSLTKEEFDAQTGLDSSRYESEATTTGTEVKKRVTAAQSDMRYEKNQLENLIDEFVYKPRKSQDPEIETLLLNVKDIRSLRSYVLHLSYSVDKINFDQNMQDLIVSLSPGLIKFVSNISERTARRAVKLDAELIEYIDNPSIEVVKLAVENNPFIIQKLKNPSPDVVDYAIEMSPFAIQGLSGRFTTDQLIKATAAYLNMPEEDGGPATRNGVPAIGDVMQWMQNFQNRGVEITDYKFYRWLVDNYDYGSNIVAAYFLVSHKIYNQDIADEISKKHPKMGEVLKGISEK